MFLFSSATVVVRTVLVIMLHKIPFFNTCFCNGTISLL